MVPEIINKIFEPFFTTKELSKGTGLGLSTVVAIVKNHNGLIDVHSEVGNGTSFTVSLPAVNASLDMRKEHVEVVGLPRGHGETILVVDDEASILTITSQTLQTFGYRVLTATDGAEAVALYAQHMHEIAVVVTDMSMPLMDGPNTIRALIRINPDINIIAASGCDVEEGIAKIPGVNLRHFLTKPYTAEILLKTLRTILDETRSRLPGSGVNTPYRPPEPRPTIKSIYQEREII
jgi:CheY-like chemotaxis protein